ncbi:MAG TPA: hypothetical protein HPP56_08925, partial [Nitrospirae bacterium]|nr:hypothetical protein [Nitrospirota bacterium]
PYDKALGTFFYKVSYKNSTPALPILFADFIKLFSSIADFGQELWFDSSIAPFATAAKLNYHPKKSCDFLGTPFLWVHTLAAV